MLSEKERAKKEKVLESLATKIDDELNNISSLKDESILPDLIKSFVDLLKVN